MAKKASGKQERASTADANGMSQMEIGSKVRILNYGGQVGKIVELRGPLGPNGAQIYRVLVRTKPRREYIELRGDQLELVEADE